MLKDNYETVEKNVAAACARAGRDRSEVTLIAVSKTKPVEMLREVYDAGARDFGENKVQEIMDILYLLSVATNSESEFEMDSLEDHELLNEAHKIIYRSLYSKFFELLSNKTRFIEESASTYKEALDKYQEQHITD